MKSAIFLARRQCASPLSGGGGMAAQAVDGAATRELITPNAPDTIQRDVPGFF